jgi:hypothetical protein
MKLVFYLPTYSKKKNKSLLISEIIDFSSKHLIKKSIGNLVDIVRISGQLSIQTYILIITYI